MKWLALSIAAVLLAGCVSFENRWQPHGPVPQAAELTVQQPYEQVWNRLLTKLPTSGFRLENSDKNAGLIQVSRPSFRPSQYIDCGTTDVRKTNFHGTTSNKTFSANSLQYERYAGLIYYVVRTNRLSVLTDVKLTDQQTATTVFVDSKYTLSIDERIDLMAPGPIAVIGGAAVPTGPPSREELKNNYYSLSFTTAEVSEPYEEFRCVAKGNIESEILKAAKPEP